jgi:hypothetical protein
MIILMVSVIALICSILFEGVPTYHATALGVYRVNKDMSDFVISKAGYSLRYKAGEKEGLFFFDQGPTDHSHTKFEWASDKQPYANLDRGDSISFPYFTDIGTTISVLEVTITGLEPHDPLAFLSVIGLISLTSLLITVSSIIRGVLKHEDESD